MGYHKATELQPPATTPVLETMSHQIDDQKTLVKLIGEVSLIHTYLVNHIDLNQ